MEPKVKIKEISSYERKLTIEIPSAEIDQEMESQFASLVKSVKLKGFRPGHVPLNVVKQRYHNQVRGESISKLVDLSYSKALAQHELVPVSRPKIDLKPHENGKSLSYEALVEIKPNVEIKKYTGLQAEKEKFTLKKEEVDQAIERLRESQSQLKAIDKPRGIKDKDHIVIDFKGTLDGKVFSGGTATNLLYEMGSGQFIPDFEAGLKGMKPDENKKIDATFPKDFHDKKIAGKKTQFDVTVKEIKVKELPKLDDAFAKQTPGCKTVADLRKKAEDDLKQMHQDRVQKNLEKLLLDELVKKNPIDVPPSMVERQFEHLVQDSKQRLQQMGLQGQRLDDTVEGWKADLKERAAFDVKVVLLSEAISKKENLDVTDADLNTHIKTIAERAKTTVENVKNYYKKSGALSSLRWQLLQTKVIDWLISKAKIKEIAPKKS